MNKGKVAEVAYWSAIVAVAFLFVIGTLAAVRFFNSTITPTTVSRPEPGYVCFSMVTANGAAISCLKEKPAGADGES